MVGPPAAGVFAGGKPPMTVKPPTAGFCGGLLVLGGPGGHVLGTTQPGVAAESAVDVGGVLGSTQPSVFEQFSSGESLKLAAVPWCPQMASVVPITILVGATADSNTQAGAL